MTKNVLNGAIHVSAVICATTRVQYMLYVMAGLLIIKDSISIRNLLVIQIIGKIYLVYWFKLGICFIEYYSEVFKIHNLHYFFGLCSLRFFQRKNQSCLCR